MVAPYCSASFAGVGEAYHELEVAARHFSWRQEDYLETRKEKVH